MYIVLHNYTSAAKCKNVSLQIDQYRSMVLLYTVVYPLSICLNLFYLYKTVF